MTNLTGNNYKAEAEQAEQPVIIEFYSPYCRPCKVLEPIFEGLARDFSQQYKFCKVDVASQEGLAQQFDIMSVPTLILMQEGEILQRIRGIHSRTELMEMLNLN